MEISPSLKDFRKFSTNNNLIVFSCKFSIGLLTPISIYHNLNKTIKGDSFLLESLEGEEKICRFSFLGFEPICSFKTKGKKIYIKESKTRHFLTKEDPCAELKKILNRYRVAPKENLRFFGGFVGYLGYDVIKFYEPVGGNLPDPLGTYDSYFILSKFLIIFDHLKRQIEVLSFVTVNRKTRLKEVYLKERNILGLLCAKIVGFAKLPDLSFNSSKLKIKANFKKKDFLAAVKKAKKYIQ